MPGQRNSLLRTRVFSRPRSGAFTRKRSKEFAMPCSTSSDNRLTRAVLRKVKRDIVPRFVALKEKLGRENTIQLSYLMGDVNTRVALTGMSGRFWDADDELDHRASLPKLRQRALEEERPQCLGLATRPLLGVPLHICFGAKAAAL